MDRPTRHQLLRDRRAWLGARHGLAIDREGALQLARVPAPADGRAVDIVVPYPYAREVSGLATGPCEALFLADTAHDRVLFIDGLCGSQAWLPPAVSAWADAPGHFRAPRGLALGADALQVADSGNARLQSLARPGLEAADAWTGLGRPTSLAIDAVGRLLVVDAQAKRVHRVLANGAADAAFDATLAAQGQLLEPLFVAVGAEDAVWVSDAQANAVFRFDASGAFVSTLAGPAGWLPGALACSGERLYAADASDGRIHVFDGSVVSGQVRGWRGPVTALAVAADGTLFIKPGLDAAWFRFEADAAFATAGELTAGPFDAGVESRWERAWIEADSPRGGAVAMHVVLQDAPSPPLPADWVPLPSADALLAVVAGVSRRFVWLRLSLSSATASTSPRVLQARAATAAENYLEYLPMTYGQHDGDNGVLSRWLRLWRGEFGRIEELLDDMPRLADPQLAAPASLPWLARWLALELPRIADDEARRTLIAGAVQRFARRGTPASIADFVELHTGIRPAISEAFAERNVWSLGSTSLLGFDTRLAPLDPLGMVVPDEEAGAGCCVRSDEPAHTGCAPCAPAAPPAADLAAMPIGRAVVGAAGPLASHELGLPLFAEAAYRFCVTVDAYRVHDPALLAEVVRIVEREKPAHTDYRLEVVAPELRIGWQARVGIDTIVGGDPPALRLGPARIGVDTRLPPNDVPRIGDTILDGGLILG